MDTVIEWEWEPVMSAVRRAQEKLLSRCDRVYLILAVDEHGGVSNRLDAAVEAVERDLGRKVGG